VVCGREVGNFRGNKGLFLGEEMVDFVMIVSVLMKGLDVKDRVEDCEVGVVKLQGPWGTISCLGFSFGLEEA
jgi:hypothetical protein